MSIKLKEKSEKELEKMLKESREALRDFRFGMAGSNKKDVKEGKQIRKKIAEILTEINSR